MNKRISLNLVVYATVLALTAVFGWMPYGVFMLPLLFVACNFDFKLSLFAGFAFGIISLIYTYISSGTSLIALYFLEYPWMPVVPRIFVGMIAFGTYRLSAKLIKSNNIVGRAAPVAITAAIGSISNTILVGSSVLLINRFAPISGEEIFTLGQLIIAGISEVVLNAVILPPIVLASRKAMPKLFKEITPNHPLFANRNIPQPEKN